VPAFDSEHFERASSCMAADGRDRLLLLEAELADERVRVARLPSESEHATRRFGEPDTETLGVYDVAAMLPPYTGMDRALLRIATTIDVQPTGSNGHRDLLTSMKLQSYGPPCTRARNRGSLESASRVTPPIS
jgi:hypothetical protein